MRTPCGPRPAASRWFLALPASIALCAGSAAAQPTRTIPSVLSLADAISIAIEGSTQLGIRDAQLDAARKARLNALFNLGPDFSVDYTSAASTRTELDVVLDRDPVGPIDSLENVDIESDFRQYGASTSIRLFDGFGNLARLSAAHNDVRAEEFTFAYVRKQVQQNVIAAYYNLLRAQLLRRVAEEAEAVSREQLQRTEALYELGSAARSDVLKSQVQHGNTRLDLVRARNLERTSHVDLEYVMNLMTDAPFGIDTTVTHIEFKSAVFGAERDYALEHREDLLALRAGETASSRRLWAARSGLSPTLDFSYGLSQTRQTSPFRFGATENRDRQWAFRANWNLWDRFQTYAGIGQARASRRIAEYNLRQAELDAIREVRNLVNDLEEARERLTVSRENIERSKEDLRLAQEKFRVGAGTILDTITAESDLTATKANEVEAIVDYLIARANLARATGRPFSEL